MVTDDVQAKLYRILEGQLAVKPADGHPLVLYCSALDYVELATSIELAFKVDCRPEEVEAAQTFGGVLQLVRGKLFGDGLHGEGTA